MNATLHVSRYSDNLCPIVVQKRRLGVHSFCVYCMSSVTIQNTLTEMLALEAVSNSETSAVY